MNKKSGPKRTPAQVDSDRAEIARRYLRGELMREIGLSLDLSESQVSRDIAWMREQWRKQYATDIQEHLHAQLAKIDLLEQTYWHEWELSRQPATTTTRSDSRQIEKTVHRTGNPTYLAGVQACINQRCLLIGLLGNKPPVTIDTTATAGEDDLTEEQLRTMSEEEINRFYMEKIKSLLR